MHFHHIRRSTAPHRHSLYAWVPPSPRVRCRLPKGVYYLTLPYLSSLYLRVSAKRGEIECVS